MSDSENPEMVFTSLRQQIERLKFGIDRCFMPSVYVHTFKIAQLMKEIDSIKKTENQKKVYEFLDSKALEQFERISKGRCSCSISNDI